MKLFFFAQCMLFSGAVVAQSTQQPDLVLSGTLDGKDNHSYKLVPFQVPLGIDRITIQFEHSGRDEKTTVDLGLLGPDGFNGSNGFRGWSGGNKSLFTVSTTDATPSYLPGPISAGRWNLLLGIPNIRSGAHAQFAAKVYFSRNGQIPDLLDVPLRTAPGWYRGDLHMHDAHSDGSCATQSGNARLPCPLFLTASAAAERHLDFIAVTDHNTVSHANEIRELQPYFDRLLLIPGRELTTFQGHANLLGTMALVDFRVGSREVPDWNALLTRATPLGGLVSINHPVRPSGEICMGCGWTPQPPIDLHLVQALEIVNGVDADTPISGIPVWQAALDRGYRLTAVGGSDNHDAKLTTSSFGGGQIGVPTTVVHAENLSQRAILAGIRAGHVFVDVGSSGDTHRLLEFAAHTDSGEAIMGDEVRVAKNQNVDFNVHVERVTGGSIEVFVDGKLEPLVVDNKVIQDDQNFRFAWSGDGSRHELRVAVRDAAGKLALIGNPIYVNIAAARTKS